MIHLTRRSHKLMYSSVSIVVLFFVLTYTLNGSFVFLSLPDHEVVHFPQSDAYRGVENYPSVVFNNDDTEISNMSRENATLFSLVRNSELLEMIETVKNVEERFNRNYHYDWNFMNDEEFTKEFMVRIRKVCSGRVIFTRIPKEYWSIPESIDVELMERGMRRLVRDKVIYADSRSYRNMCRFNSGFFYRMNVMNNYRYYWRVEPKTSFQCDIPDDLFKVMREGNKKYGFTMSLTENRKTVRQLWRTSLDFFDSHNEYMNPEFDMSFISNNNGDTFNMCHFWSNFEIADLEFFRDPKYNEYFEHLDRTGNFFYERWGDAPVHTIAASFLLRSPNDLQFFPNTGYGHRPNRSCPQSESLRVKLNCDCEVDDDFTYEKWSCVPKYLKVFKQPLPEGVRNL